MFTREGKTLLRILFKSKIQESNGQAFEDLFIKIMNYSEPEFQAIKPWGSIGDRKNDGYIESKGIFFQVYAPQEPAMKYKETITKLKKDFTGLKSHWQKPINEFYFVLNDKFLGVHPDAEQTLKQIRDDNNLSKAEFKTAKSLENDLFTLDGDQILTIVGGLPDPAKINNIDYSVFDDVINYIMVQPFINPGEANLHLPDWDNKIKFNNLSGYVKHFLINGQIQLSHLEKYLNNNGDFLAAELRDKINELYIMKKKEYSGNELFWEIMTAASPRANQSCQSAVIVIMSKYFESCDIFEEPAE